MSSINNVVLSGRLTAEPALRKTTTGKSVCGFSLAVGRVVPKDAPQTAITCDFINCVAWERLAEVICGYCHKGSKINVMGKLQTRNYEDPNIPNRKVFITEVLVLQLELLDGKPQPTAQQTAEQPTADDTTYQITDEDLPF